jgi:hypothetical protein
MSHKTFILLSFLCIAGTAQAQSAESQQPAAATAQTASQPKPGDRSCLTQTGSSIQSASGQCLPTATGSAYTQEDVDRTGATHMGEALSKLDPSVTIRH